MQRAMSLREFAALDLKPTPLPVLLGMIDFNGQYVVPTKPVPVRGNRLHGRSSSRDNAEAKLAKVPKQFRARDMAKLCFISSAAANMVILAAREMGLVKIAKLDRSNGNLYEKVTP